jgi:2-polyprenyl-3-methyl-5-hydroxy-6-metoxy-1,4-benzoquinol methylase
MDASERDRAILREMRKLHSYHQMRGLLEDEARREGRDDLPLRVPEAESMDHEERHAFMLNNRPLDGRHAGVISLLAECCPSFDRSGSLLDIGCGTGELPVVISLVFPEMSIVGADASPECVEEARSLAAGMGLARPPRFVRARLPQDRMPGRFDTVFARSSMHHFARGGDFWAAVKRHSKPEGAIFVFDLIRPLTQRIARMSVDAAFLSFSSVPQCHRESYFKSFLAAFRPSEVRAHLVAAGLSDVGVRITGPPGCSPTHMVAWRDAKRGE